MAALDYHTVPSLLGPQASTSPLEFFHDSPPSTPTRLGPCEVDDALWAKMSSASGPNKKRKKSDNKPQAQLNKCLNEKRRREQENIYIEELAELISASFADMSSLSVKPDKSAILHETVSQIRKIKEQESGSDAVQQGEVSSSKPNILTNEVFGPLLLEALEGFLFVVNTEGKVEYVTENVSQFIKYTQEEVIGMTIYNILHVGDHARFSASLLPMWGGSGSGSSEQPRNRTFNSRFLVKPPDEGAETMEQKQQRVSKYENMQISCMQLPNNGSRGDDEVSDAGPCLMCVARRIPPNEKQLGAPIEQFTMKLDTSGTIMDIDSTGVSSSYAQFLNKDLKNRSLKELCHSADLGKLSNHLKETIQSINGTSTSPIYRLRVGHDKQIHVQTKSKLFKGGEIDFIMATHSIIGDNDLAIAEVMSNNTSSGSSGSSGVGGPLISSVNGSSGTSRLVSSGSDLNTITLNNSTTLHSVTLSTNDLTFEFDTIFPTTTWGELGVSGTSGTSSGGSATDDRGNTGWGSSGTPAQSPLYSSAPVPPSFSFSPLGHEQSVGDPTDQEGDPLDGGGSESGRLRNLLEMKRSSTDSSESESSSARNKMLKSLLQEEDDGDKAVTHQPANTNNTANNMLLKLLNDKSDEDDLESRSGLKKHSELLHQLLKEEENNSEGVGTMSPERVRKRPSSEDDDSTLSVMKRSMMESSGQPPSSGSAHAAGVAHNSKLWEKNKMLASLLAKQPSTPTHIPPIPESVITATPQDKMPRLIKQPQVGNINTSISSGGSWSGGMVGGASQIVGRQSIRMVARAAGNMAVASQASVVGFQNKLWDQSCSDPDLSDILDQVIEIVPEAVTADSPALINMISETPVSLGSSTSSVASYAQDLIDEKSAINAIQKSLMQCETAVKSPVYTNSVMGSGQQFPPPPVYQQRPRFQAQLQNTSVAAQRQNSQFLQQQHVLLQQQQQQHRSKLIAVQQQKQRLLQQQQQQQLLIPSSAASAPVDPNLHNIGSLMNDSVAPNVALQRSANVADSQLSPVSGYGTVTSQPQSIISSPQISPAQTQRQGQPYSPQPFSPVSYQGQGGQQGGGAGAQQGNQQSRLSPASLASYQSQLSPRVPQGGQTFATQQGTSWSQQQASRLSLQQQQNPMLNAQLAAGNGTGGNSSGGAAAGFASGGTNANSRFQSLPPVRSLTSPGSRQSPYPPELSPTSAASYQFRLQRSMSGPPQATTQLPGVSPALLGRHHYGGKEVSSAVGGYQQAGGGGPLYPPPPPGSGMGHHHAPHPPSHHHTDYYQEPPPVYPHHHASAPHHRGGGSNGMTEYVRQELRAVLGARTSTLPNRQPQTHQQSHDPTLDDLNLPFDMPTPVNDSSKMWANLGDMGAGSPQAGASPHNSRNTVEEVSRSNEQKSSLLQKLLSE